jgi:hypothetical protein
MLIIIWIGIFVSCPFKNVKIKCNFLNLVSVEVGFTQREVDIRLFGTKISEFIYSLST